MKINRNKTALALASSSALFLSACNDDDNHITGEVPTSAQLTLTAMDGYINNALICADVNENSQCEASEIVHDIHGNYVLTNDQGKVDTLISLEDDALLKKHTMMIATVRTFDPDSDIFSEDMDLPDHSMNPITLRAPAGSTMINPITDMVVAKMNVGQEQTRAPKMTKEQAQKEVVAALSDIDKDKLLTEEMLYDDYITDKKSSDLKRVNLAKKSHKVAQILAESKSNATSDALFDQFSDQIIEIATAEVESMEDDKLDNPDYKPYVPINSDTVNVEIVKNNKVQFNTTVMDKLAGMLADQKGLYGAVGQWTKNEINLSDLTNDITRDDRTGIEALITDLDDDDNDNNHDITVSNKLTLKNNNLLAQFNHDNQQLILSRINAEDSIPGGEYSILISTNDLNANGEPITVTDVNGEYDVVTTSTTKLTFTVVNENIAPKVNDVKRKEIQTDIASFNLIQGENVGNNIFIDIQDLFSDVNGDTTFRYVLESHTPGLTIKETQGTGAQIQITGKPVISEGNTFNITAIDIGGLETKATFELSVKKANNSLLDFVTANNAILYKWKTQVENEKVNTVCQGIKLDSHTYGYDGSYTSITTVDKCPTEEKFNKRSLTMGSWEASSTDIVMTDNKGNKITFTGLVDHLESDIPSITTFEKEKQSEVTKNSEGHITIMDQYKYNGLTLYKGYEVAANSWNKGIAKAWINDKDVKITATSTRIDDNSYVHLDTFVLFDKSCEDLGLGPNIKEEGTPIKETHRWSKINAIHAKEENLFEYEFETVIARPYEENYCDIYFRITNDGIDKVQENDSVVINFISENELHDSDIMVNTITIIDPN